jgi:uncharacterized protein (DUF983 family)
MPDPPRCPYCGETRMLECLLKRLWLCVVCARTFEVPREVHL